MYVASVVAVGDRHQLSMPNLGVTHTWILGIEYIAGE